MVGETTFKGFGFEVLTAITITLASESFMVK
jgi:hypothetical protein